MYYKGLSRHEVEHGSSLVLFGARMKRNCDFLHLIVVKVGLYYRHYYNYWRSTDSYPLCGSLCAYDSFVL